MTATSIFRWMLMLLAALMLVGVFAIVHTVVNNGTASSRTVDLLVPILVGLSIMIVASAFPLSAFLWVMFLLRRKRATDVLTFVEQAVVLNLPLPRIFGSFSDNQPYSTFARTMLEAKSALEQGAPIAAVMAGVPSMPPRVLSLLSAAERVGRVPQVMTRLMNQRREALKHYRFLAFEMTYPLLVVFVCLGVVSIFMLRAAPKFESIVKDFGVQMPAVTRTSIDVWRSGGGFIWLAFLIVAAGVFAFTRAGGGRAKLGFNESPRERLLNRLPWIGKARSYHALGDALHFAADAVEAGRPIEEALLEAAEIPTNSKVRGSIGRWVQLMVQGQAISVAASNAALPKLVSDMLATQHTSEDTSEILRFLGRYYIGRFSRSMELLRAAIPPASSLVLGVAVAWVMFTIISPLLVLPDSLLIAAQS